MGLRNVRSDLKSALVAADSHEKCWGSGDDFLMDRIGRLVGS